jgi:hypothetical protein
VDDPVVMSICWDTESTPSGPLTKISIAITPEALVVKVSR